MTDRNPILIIQDNPDDEELSIRAMKQGLLLNEIVIIHDGLEVIKFISATENHLGQVSPAMPQLVLLDLKLPKLGGLNLLKFIRADPCTQNLPAILLTSSAEEERIYSTDNEKATAFMRKPVDFQRFLEAAKKLGLYWLLVDHNE